MSTVKIKTETATAATTAAVNDVKVKLEPSLSTADIKLEQHTSDIDTKVESDSEADSEEGDIKSESDDDNDDGDTDQNAEAPENQEQFICKHPGCGRSFKKSRYLNRHQPEHRLQIQLNVLGKTYILTRQSLNDRWSCPILDCTSTFSTVNCVYHHVRRYHSSVIGQQQQQQQSPEQMTQRNFHFFDVDDFYVNSVRCGYHTTTSLFLCYKCRSVPGCLLTHLQQKHGYDEESIDSSALPESAVNSSADPNGNQHTGNTLLAAAISQPYQQQHRDIVQGWLCVTSDCGYYGYTADNKAGHKKKMHRGERLETVPALVLRLVFGKVQSSCFLITRIDQASGAVTASSSNKVNRRRLDCSHSGLNTQDENEDDSSRNETTVTSNQKRRFVCEYINCGQFFNSSSQLGRHRREHKLKVMINMHSNTFSLTRQSLDDRWACPIPDCDSTYKAVSAVHKHILTVHHILVKQKRTTMDDDSQQQQPVIKKRQCTFHYLKVDDFYVIGVRCGYHTATGLFICYECRLVPECLLTHLQQKHGYDEKSIDSSVLPESARIANTDPNINQHINNQLLAVAIRDPSQLHHQNIVQGWLCVTSNCGHCGYLTKHDHKKYAHKGEQISTVPALVLRLAYTKALASYFLITGIDQASSAVINSSNRASQQSIECDDDDGDELVLSDYSDEDDVN